MSWENVSLNAKH